MPEPPHATAPPALYWPQDGHLVATELTRGPWDLHAQHGGAPAALIMRAFEALPSADGLLFARITYELLRPVPVAPLRLEAEVVRPGRRVQLLEATLTGPAGLEVMRARALQVHRAEVAGLQGQPVEPPPGPEAGKQSPFQARHRPMFATDAMEIRFVVGGFGELGDATAWFRLRHQVVGGEPASALQRLAAAADFGNGISSPLSWDSHTFINPDLTIYLERPPQGEWIGLQAKTRIAPAGIGISEGVLCDDQGRVGRATQSLLVARR